MNRLRHILFLALVVTPAVYERPARADAVAEAVADAGEDQYAVAAEHYRQQRWQLAADEFASLLDKFPDHARRDDAEFFLAESQVQLGDFAAAAEHFRAYRDRAPQGRYAKSALFRGGEAAYLAGSNDEATEQLTAFLAAHADDELAAYALPYLGRIALDSKQNDTAEHRFRQALDKFPAGPLAEESRFGLARALEQQGDHAAAEQGFAAIAAQRDSPIADVAQFRLGLVRYTRGDYSAAETTFANLIADFPRSQLAAKSDYWRALSIKAQRRWDEAAKLLIAAAERDPRNPLSANLRYHAGDALLAAGKSAAASEQFDRVLADHAEGELADDALLGKMQAALAIDPAAVEPLAEQWTNHADSPLSNAARRIRAQALLQRQQYDAAIEQLQSLAAEAVPTDDSTAESEQQTAVYLLAVALHGAGKYDEALAQFAQLESIADEPLKRTVQLGRASTLVRLRRFEEARPLLEAFLTAHANGPDAATCLAELAFCNAGQGQFNDARQRYEAFAKLPVARSTLLSTTHRLAEMAYRGGSRDWAAELFAVLAADGNPSEYVARGLSGQAWCQFSKDDLAGSAATFLRLVEQFPSDPLAAEGALVRGKALEKLGDYDPALLMYRTLIDNFPNAPETPAALFAAAELHERLKQYSDAEGYYRRLLQNFADDAKTDATLYQLAWLLRGGNDAGDDLSNEAEVARRNAEAETLFERIRHQHKLSPYWADAVFRLAEGARNRRDAQQVEKLVGELSAAAESNTATGEPLVDAQTLAHAFYLQGRLAADLEDWAAASRAMTALIDRCEKSDLRLAAQFWVAEAAYRQAQYDEAATRFAALAVEAQSTSASWLGMIPLRRAQMLAQQKKWSEAIALAETIDKEFPDFAQQYEADYLIGRALAAEGKFDEARAFYARVTRSPTGGKTETAAMAQWMTGETYFHQQDYTAAVKEYLRVEILYAYPKWQAAALVQAGKAYESDGQWQRAIDLYTQVLRKYGQTEYAAEASTRLRVAQQRADADAGAAATR